MRLPTMRATIERRLLVNYRVDPELLQVLLPDPFRPWLVGDLGVAGICLIRLGRLRPSGVPGGIGTTTENAAHRIAVEWDTSDGIRRGVFIPRRDTSSRLTQMLGGRIFPGEHHHAAFRVFENDTRCDVSFTSDDNACHVAVSVHTAAEVPSGSVFGSLADASEFFQQGSLGYSATRRGAEADGLELRCATWAIAPAAIDHLESTFFDNPACFPPGTAVPDSAFLMRDIDATWHARAALPVRATATLPPRRASAVR